MGGRAARLAGWKRALSVAPPRGDREGRPGWLGTLEVSQEYELGPRGASWQGIPLPSGGLATRMPDPSRELAPLPGPGATPTDAAGLEAGDPQPVAAGAVRTSLDSRRRRPPRRSPLTGPYRGTVPPAC